MRTNVDIDDELLAQAMKVLGTPTKKATIEEALRQALRRDHLRSIIRDSAGIGWTGDEPEMEDARRTWDRRTIPDQSAAE